MISVSSVRKHYGEGDAKTAVLDDVSLTIEPGEFVAIIGTSGSGKTTLLNTIGTLDSRFEGSVVVDGKKVSALSETESSSLRSKYFGFVFQQFNLLDHLTALENVALPSFFGEPVKDAHARAAELLKQVGLGDKHDARPPELSGGQKQRVAIARALYREPSVMLCDEPTGSLDRKTGVEIMDVFTTLNKERGITLVMVTHEEHIAKMARRVVRMEDGKIVSDQENLPTRPSLELI